MDKQDRQDHEVERLMRRAEDLGHDPERVARAVGHLQPPPIEAQPVAEIVPRRWFGAAAARRFARRT
jgi:hypothetical protein